MEPKYIGNRYIASEMSQVGQERHFPKLLQYFSNDG